MSMSIRAIDRLFDRLAATYGAALERSFGSAPVGAVKAAWAHELAGFDGQLQAVAWALENLPERVPNVIEFRNLARKAPAPDVPRLPEPKADPERVAAELAKLQPARMEMASSTRSMDHRAWARRIVDRHAAGERVNATSLGFAREALGKNGGEG